MEGEKVTRFEDVYNEYFKVVYLYIKGLCKNNSIAQEVTDDTFFKAMKSLDSFKGECDIRVWLCQIAKNTYYSYLRKSQKLTSLDETEPPPLSQDIYEKLIDKETSFRIHSILHNMDEPYKEVFYLRVFSELSFSQIGSLFGKTQNWACVTYHRAKKKIIDELEESYNG